jgi:hypothetical protein
MTTVFMSERMRWRASESSSRLTPSTSPPLNPSGTRRQ